MTRKPVAEVADSGEEPGGGPGPLLIQQFSFMKKSIKVSLKIHVYVLSRLPVACVETITKL